MFELKASIIPGCYEIRPTVFDDSRGRFVKVFHREFFFANGLETDFPEEYYSISRRGVIRGLHFQVPPHDHVKIVYCTQGEVFDVIVDLRIGSPSYGKAVSYCLSANAANYLYIPKGIAHGFCVLSEVATLVYKVSTSYVAESDTGILWDSVSVDWPVSDPVLSSRDTGFQSFADFRSPFSFEHQSN